MNAWLHREMTCFHQETRTLNASELLIALHTLAAAIWIGGFFFANIALRPCARSLGIAAWLSLWQHTFTRFFYWCWLCIALLAITGLTTMSMEFGANVTVPIHIRVMTISGGAAIATFAYLHFAPWRQVQNAVWKSDLRTVERVLKQVRVFALATTTLGLLTLAIGASGG
jgi:uncharacterized membrane protein